MITLKRPFGRTFTSRTYDLSNPDHVRELGDQLKTLSKRGLEEVLAAIDAEPTYTQSRPSVVQLRESVVRWISCS